VTWASQEFLAGAKRDFFERLLELTYIKQQCRLQFGIVRKLGALKFLINSAESDLGLPDNYIPEFPHYISHGKAVRKSSPQTKYVFKSETCAKCKRPSHRGRCKKVGD
jgi:hypothetical protein